MKDNKVSFKDYFSVIKAIILKPFTGLKDEINKISNILSAGILALIIAALATILTLIKTIITTVRVTSIWNNETSWVWDNISNINFVKAIGLNFIIFLGLIAAVAFVYYIGSLILKKQADFPKLLGIAVTTTLPVIICYTLISPILGMIWGLLGLLATVIGLVYTLILTYELMSEELSLKENSKFYLNLICLTIISAIIYYIIIYLLIANVANGLNGIFNL